MAQMNVSRRSFLAASTAAAGAIVLALGGCGGGEKKQGAAEGKAVEGGTLTAAIGYSTSNSYTPVGVSAAAVMAAYCHTCEALYDLDYHTYEAYPALAAGEPEKVSETEYHIALREGAKFSDGTDVTPADVVNAIKVEMENALYAPFLSFIDKVTEEANGVCVMLKYPAESLLKCRLATCRVFPKGTAQEDLDKGTFLGTGPWVIKSCNFDAGGAVDFEPNPNYNGSYPATAAAMHWDIITDETARTQYLTEATAQVMESVPAANIDLVKQAGATAESLDSFSLAFLMFNTVKKPFDDYRVRQALFYAIDIEKLINNQLAGYAKALTCFLPETHANYHQAATVYTYDPEKAKTLLADAGVKDLKLELMVNDRWPKDLAAQIKENWDAVLGDNAVTLNVCEVDWAAFNDPKDAKYDILLTPGDPSCFGNDPDLWMSWWYGDNIWTTGRTFWQHSDKKTFDKLQDLMQQAREATGDAQQELFNQCFDLIAEQVPLYPLMHRQVTTAWWPNLIAGFKPVATTGLYFLGASCTEESAK